MNTKQILTLLAVTLFSLTGLTMMPASRVISQEPTPSPAQVAVERLGKAFDVGLTAIDALNASDQAAATTSARQSLNGLVGAASQLYNADAGDPIGEGDQNGIVTYISQLKSLDPAPSPNWVAAAENVEFFLNQAVEHNQAAIAALTADPVDFEKARLELRVTLAFLNAAKGRPNAATASPSGALPEGFSHDTRTIEGGALLLLDCSGGDMASCP
ncbi:MAG: hypothetical protein HY314_01450 [Acidobacteria bacterium]|nr:hypothetical protein [Acidobacteriota bacterium]